MSAVHVEGLDSFAIDADSTNGRLEIVPLASPDQPESRGAVLLSSPDGRSLVGTAIFFARGVLDGETIRQFEAGSPTTQTSIICPVLDMDSTYDIGRSGNVVTSTGDVRRFAAPAVARLFPSVDAAMHRLQDWQNHSARAARYR